MPYCHHCDYYSERKYNLQRHIENWHLSVIPPRRGSRTGQRSHQCCLCSLYYAPDRDSILRHYVDVHDVNLQVTVHNFENIDAFQNWKTNLEKREVSWYTVFNRRKEKKCETIYYRCHRDGYYKAKGTGKRHLKQKGSNKIDGCCPSNMIVKVMADGKVSTKFLPTHVGHSNEVGRLRLSKEDRDMIAKKISQQVPLPTILNLIRNSLSSSVDRIQLCRLQDLKNIIRDKNLDKVSISPKNDLASVDSWVSEISETSSLVRLYKPQHAMISEYREYLGEEDFVLILATDAQLESLVAYGSKYICVDGTHGTNAYGLDVTTILTLDESHQGLPCGFLICNRVDEQIMSLYFSVIKRHINSHAIKTLVFESDMAPMYYNAWSAVMLPPSRHLYCTWHVDRALRNRLHLVKTTEKRAYTYWLIRTLLQELDQETFIGLFDNSIKELDADVDTQDFAKYLNDEYASCAELWAHCYRVQAYLNTNLQSMHEVIKHIFFHRRKIRPLDKALSCFMMYLKDKSFSRPLDTTIVKLTGKMDVLRKRHTESLKLNTKIIEIHNGWEVWSKGNLEFNIVQKNLNKDCINCELKCEECCVCIHDFFCSCSDNSINLNMCKHIHYVALFLKHDNLFYGSDLDIDDSNDYVIEEGQDIVPKREITIEVIDSVNEKLDLEAKKKEVEKLYHDSLALCKSSKDYDILISALLSATHTIKSQMNECTSLLHE